MLAEGMEMLDGSYTVKGMTGISQDNEGNWNVTVNATGMTAASSAGEVNFGGTARTEIDHRQRRREGGIYINKYLDNTDTRAAGGFSLYTSDKNLYNSTFAHTSFHTHLSRFGDNSRLVPSGSHDNGQSGDLRHKAMQSQNGVQKFIIITNPETFEY